MADFEDLFTGALDTNLTDHTPDVGTAWTGGGSTTDNARLNGNGEIKAEGNESQHTIFSDDMGSPDHQIWFRVALDTSVLNSRVCCRAGDAANNSYGIGCATDGGDLAITYRDGGSTNSLASHTHGLTDPFWVRLKCEGDTVSAWKSQSEPASPEDDTNWTKIGEWTVTVNNTVQKPGLFLFGTSANQTNLDPWLDTYKASALSGGGGDTTAPTYGVAPAIDSKTDTTATADATASDETDASVDHYAVILSDGAAAPSGDQIKAGTDGNDSAAVDSGSSTGVNNGVEASIQFTGLSASTAYDVYWVVEDSSGNQNVGTKLDVTTNASTVTKGVSVTLYDRATQSIRASITGIVARWWDSPTATGAPLLESTTESTDASGVIEIDLDSVTSLNTGQNGYLVLYKEQSDKESDWHFAARVPIEDIS